MLSDTPGLDALLAEYAALLADGAAFGVPSPRAPSPLSPAQLDQLEADLGLALPADYRALALTYNLNVIEVYFSHFHPTFKHDLPDALRFAFRDVSDPDMSEGYATWSRNAQEYRAWGVIPVGDDFLQRELVMTVCGVEPVVGTANVGGPATTEIAYDIPYREMPHTVRPVGTVWAFTPSNHNDPFTFVSSTFTQALWSALYLRVRLRPSLGDEPALDEAEALAALTAHDLAIAGASYWQTWAYLLAHD